MPALGPNGWSYVVLAAVLAAAAATDVRSGKIYNWITYPAMLAGLLGHAITGGVWGGPERLGLLGAAAGLAVGFGSLLPAWKAGGIGGGDVKLLGAVGALLGWRGALAVLFFSLLTAVLMAMILMLRKRILRDTFLRLSRFFLLWIGRTRSDVPITPQSPAVPFGLAVGIGAAVALAVKCCFGSGAGLLPPGW